jgi:hypothetical protein
MPSIGRTTSPPRGKLRAVPSPSKKRSIPRTETAPPAKEAGSAEVPRQEEIDLNVAEHEAVPQAANAPGAERYVGPQAIKSGQPKQASLTVVKQPKPKATSSAAPPRKGTRSAPARVKAGKLADLLDLEVKLTPKQSEYVERILKSVEDRRLYANLDSLAEALDAADEAGRWKILQGVKRDLDIRIGHTEATRRGEYASKDIDPELYADEGVHQSESAHMVITEGAERVGALRGREFAEKKLGLRDTSWINPFEGRRSRFGLGFDDVMVDPKTGDLWILEYKGGTADLSPGQMSPKWVNDKIRQYRRLGGWEGQEWANRLETARKAKKLHGVLLKTEIIGRIAQPTVQVGQPWDY